MGRPFHEKYANVVWEIPGASAPDADSKATESHPEVGGNLQKWKDGKTGYPIVDAGMRCAREMGWMHNRTRMICAMFLCKHLMIDWREGERVRFFASLYDFCAL
jgi:deoxyribodipyrimidine photo-lyase